MRERGHWVTRGENEVDWEKKLEGGEKEKKGRAV